MHYMHDADLDLMIFSLRNYNEIFLKNALNNNVFTLQMLQKDEIIEEMLAILR